MARSLACDSCGISDDRRIRESRITGVELTIGTEKGRAARRIVSGDWCPTCTGLALHQFFGINAHGELEIPAFVQPRRENA